MIGVIGHNVLRLVEKAQKRELDLVEVNLSKTGDFRAKDHELNGTCVIRMYALVMKTNN